MLLPFDSVLRRGVILLWKQYGELDDRAFAGQTKAKFLVILSATPHDDPIVYILTTSSKPKHILHPDADCGALMAKIARSPRASRRVKQILGLNGT